MKMHKIVQLIIFLISLLLIAGAMLFHHEPSADSDLNINTILLSIGCSILAVVIINFFEYHITRPEVDTLKYISDWKLVSIFKTRQEMNDVTNKLLNKAEALDIAALGCKGLLNYQGDVIKQRLKKGMKIRFLIPTRNSPFIQQREIDEDAAKDEIKNNINNLVNWSQQTIKELNLNEEQIQIKEYSSLPIQSIMIIDKNLFTGPFMIKKLSQLTMAYQYKKGGEGYSYYKSYFNEIWNNDEISSKVEV
ncbi:hypothetical protein [Photobacterium kagoshimensis]|uniref:hypothetical protein n=1 Tax=Photobacterium kagoshimensis TaxID=2910242 RepID=UPI003D1456AB